MTTEKETVWCWYCGNETNRPHREHRQPRSRNGNDTDNIVMSCPSCNIHKSSRTVEEFRGYISRLPETTSRDMKRVGLMLRFFDIKPKNEIMFHGERKCK